ncbi:Probable lipoprotein precursor. Putative lipopolysaccharide assembly protein LptC [Tenacibaculum maritimum]|uniref:LPS export ABC transporter periplasmic protein LptC n=1 Tax=Tenacibaculum maritimum TaxID=107401 RepID=UPI0012E5BCA3|nr:LPS export ABC transporter periplasmic protein LptC [Tenacibaculum maritimum]CAA0229499.1 Probable lipoprotein precursor. Putative lipopolysaccharide assembly protein LptC [Tenacibaculum maritimum]
MKKYKKNRYINIAAISLVAMFFSCTNDTKKVRDFLADRNLPIGIAKNTNHVYKDSGRVRYKLVTPLLYDFSNRKEHPYKEFLKGIKIVTIEKNEKDSTTITGNYALSFDKTRVAEIKGNVVILNHSKSTKLETNQLFWDQKEGYFFTEDGFRLTTEKDTINGFGFESKQDLSKWIAKDITGKIETIKD